MRIALIYLIVSLGLAGCGGLVIKPRITASPTVTVAMIVTTTPAPTPEVGEKP